MSIPEKITPDFFTQSIQSFNQPLALRAQIGERPCQWIQELDQEHGAISDSMQKALEAAETVRTDLLKKLRPRMAAIGAVGLGAGIGGFFAIVGGGLVLSLALGIIGALAGVIAGVFLGLWAAKADSVRKSRPNYQAAFTMEAVWIQGKMQQLNDLIQANGPDTAQLNLLKTHFEGILRQQTELTTLIKGNRFFQQLDAAFAPSKGTNEANLLEAWKKPASG